MNIMEAFNGTIWENHRNIWIKYFHDMAPSDFFVYPQNSQLSGKSDEKPLGVANFKQTNRRIILFVD